MAPIGLPTAGLVYIGSPSRSSRTRLARAAPSGSRLRTGRCVCSRPAGILSAQRMGRGVVPPCSRPSCRKNLPPPLSVRARSRC